MLKNRISFSLGELIISVTSFLYRHSENNRFYRVFWRMISLLLSSFGYSVLPIESTGSFREKYNTIDVKPLIEERKGFSCISTIPQQESGGAIEKKLDDLYLAICPNVFLSGNSDVIIAAEPQTIINDFCYNVNNNILCSDGLLFREKNNVGIVRKTFGQKPVIVKEGILLSGKFSFNYYHMLFENLSRAMLLRYISLPSDIPLLVDESILRIPSLSKTLDYLVDISDRKKIYISSSNLYLCEKLYYFNHIHYIIPHRKRVVKNDNNLVNFYDFNLLEKQRDILLFHKVLSTTPRRLFLTRAKTSARNYNEDQIYSVLKRYNFVIIDPVSFSLEEQMTLFSNAEWIVGGSGAAFSNILFCNSGCKILCFRASKEIEGVSVFSPIALSCGAMFWHYPADRIESSNGLHSNYYIDPVKFEQVLNMLNINNL